MNHNTKPIKKQYLTPYSQSLRHNNILSEALLWNCLKGRGINNLKFNRQKPMGDYIVDFYCSSIKTVIEIDGATHDHKYSEDVERDKFLNSYGIKVIRIADSQIRFNLNDVLEWLKVNLK